MSLLLATGGAPPAPDSIIEGWWLQPDDDEPEFLFLASDPIPLNDSIQGHFDAAEDDEDVAAWFDAALIPLNDFIEGYADAPDDEDDASGFDDPGLFADEIIQPVETARIFGDPGLSWFLRQKEPQAPEKVVLPPDPQYLVQRDNQKAAQAEQARLQKSLARAQAQIQRLESWRDRWREQYLNAADDERRRDEQILRWQQIEAQKRADEAALLNQIAAQIAAENEAALQMELMLQAEEIELAAFLLLN